MKTVKVKTSARNLTKVKLENSESSKTQREKEIIAKLNSIIVTYTSH